MQEIALELVAVVGNVLARVFADEQHLSDVRFRLRVALESILVAHLPFADL